CSVWDELCAQLSTPPRAPPSFPTRRSSDLSSPSTRTGGRCAWPMVRTVRIRRIRSPSPRTAPESSRSSTDRLPHWPATVRTLGRSEEHTSELQSRFDLVCRLLLEKKNRKPK